MGSLAAAAAALGRGKYGGNGANLSHFGNIIISPDRKTKPRACGEAVTEICFLQHFLHNFAIITSDFTSTTLCYKCPAEGEGEENMAQNSISKVRDGNAGELVAQGE